ncbi:MAG: Transcriptional regulator, TetR family [uncultured Sulfurovum sp.]|uniref:Transcriptional regulator, TetR family n=1 Tax=uncultured Sulfurovum sp. TaxID=269237 RepID=A0A6S6UAX3_9BACT|nr:MAG: Transcriptional regulator, TetR family [uncultured Sulfurovum sp.]
MKKKQSTREEILDAIFMLVYINGYNGTSMSMILKECNIPKGSLYHYFKSKKEMVLAVIKERLAPRMDKFYNFTDNENKHSIDILIDTIINISQKEQLIKYGCPLNRLNQEMSSIDKDFESAITQIYNHIREKIVLLLNKSNLEKDINIEKLSEFVIANVWGALSLSPTQSSKKRYLDTISYLIDYLKSLKN